MTLLLLLGLALLAASAALLARVATLGRSAAAATIAQIDAYGFGAGAADGAAPRQSLAEGVDALAGSAGALLARRFGESHERELRALLQAAGLYGTTPRKFMGYRLLLGVFAPPMWVWLAAVAGISTTSTVIGFLFAAFAGWYGPLYVVKRRARERLERIDHEMPELVDLLVTCVEAGLGFSGALQIAATRTHGPLAQELRLALQEQSFGLTMTDALSNVLERADTPSMRSFVQSILQGESLGVSIGKILRDLATEMRKRRRQVAEEKAQKTPTKILFPLILLIFPALFVVILGPVLIHLGQELGG